MKTTRICTVLGLLTMAMLQLASRAGATLDLHFAHSQFSLEKNLTGAWQGSRSSSGDPTNTTPFTLTIAPEKEKETKRWRATLKAGRERLDFEVASILGPRLVLKTQGTAGSLVLLSARQTEPGVLQGEWSVVSADGRRTSQATWRATGGSYPLVLARSILRQPDPLERHRMIGELMNRVRPSNAEDLAEIILKGPRSSFAVRDFQGLFAHVWGRVDGERAMAAMKEMAGARVYGGPYLAQGLSGWALTDREAAKAWVDALADRRERTMAVMGFLNSVLAVDPVAASRYLEEFDLEPTGRRFAVRMVTDRMLDQRGTDFAGKWAQTLEDEEMRITALGELARSLARDDPAKAATWLSRTLKLEKNEDVKAANSAVGEIAKAWARNDPKDTLEWLSGLPASLQPEGMKDLFAGWVMRDAEAAALKLKALPVGRPRDFAIDGFATRLAREDPEAAVAWANSISDPEIKQDALVRVAQVWWRSDAAAAGAWLEESGLDPKLIREVRQFRRGSSRGSPPIERERRR